MKYVSIKPNSYPEATSLQLEQLAYYFFIYAHEQGNPYELYPLGTQVEEFGAPYIEISDTGKLALVAKARGLEKFRKVTTSPEVLANGYEHFNRDK